MSSAPVSRLRRMFARLASGTEERDAEDLQRDTRDRGAVACGSLPERSRVSVAGELRSVTIRPRAGVPALEAEVYDGSGSVTLVFLGRRRIAGIECGRQIVAHGCVTMTDKRPTMFNPRYDLRPTGRP